MPTKIVENPYKILGVSPLSSDAEITKAFSLAMKQRKYPPDAIAKARKSLMNPDERIIADYLNPIVPRVNRFKIADSTATNQIDYPVEERLTISQIDKLIEIEIDKLVRVDREQDSDRELANLVWDV
ncbi:molecular chaperone DnaJ [Chamaesiphon sp.]|uniref:molecular chaperone DnaJ n=1 Tax=Chamaesiphon sp. TaxID=2814140 RepID=UPI00359396BD